MRISRSLLGAWLVCALGPGAAPGAERVAASAQEVEPLGVGERAPAVTLLDPDGREVALAALWSEKPVVLVFYRGGW